MTKNASAAWLLFLWPSSVLADEVVLRGGGKVTGIIVERTADAIVLETAPGRVSVPLDRVASVRSTDSDLATYEQRAAKLAPNDAAAWAALARWAKGRDLRTQAREAYERVLALDPENHEANQALGRVEHDGRWITEEEANRANGLVPFEGGWVTPAERESIRRERATESAEALAVREAQARAREAEARAREAEARAGEAESGGQGAEESYGGIPLWPYVYGPAIVAPIVPFPPRTTQAPPPTTPAPAPSTHGPRADTPKPTPQPPKEGKGLPVPSKQR